VCTTGSATRPSATGVSAPRPIGSTPLRATAGAPDRAAADACTTGRSVPLTAAPTRSSAFPCAGDDTLNAAEGSAPVANDPVGSVAAAIPDAIDSARAAAEPVGAGVSDEADVDDAGDGVTADPLAGAEAADGGGTDDAGDCGAEVPAGTEEAAGGRASAAPVGAGGATGGAGACEVAGVAAAALGAGAGVATGAGDSEAGVRSVPCDGSSPSGSTYASS
jgi:hypothetical protein